MLVAFLQEQAWCNAQTLVRLRTKRVTFLVAPGVSHFLRGCHNALDDRSNSVDPVGAWLFRGACRWRLDPPSAGDCGNRDHLSPGHGTTSRLSAAAIADAGNLRRRDAVSSIHDSDGRDSILHLVN
jgi:hypothetical protein